MSRPRSLRVSIVEDRHATGVVLRDLVEGLSHTVVGVAADVAQALQLIQSTRPDVVVLDANLSGGAGIEAAQRICEETTAPLVVLAASDAPQVAAEFADAGASALLAYPPQPSDLALSLTIAASRGQEVARLRDANARLRERNQELDAFAHTLAHDLKDLLARVVGFSEALEDTALSISEEDLRRYLRTITRSGRKMSDIVDALLLLATVEGTQVPCGPLDMAAIVSATLERLASIIESRDAAILLPSEWPSAVGYAPWVEEVWLNYISNALRYGGQPPRVELGATATPDGPILFWVRDNGPGIPPDALDKLFVPFTRLEHAQRQGSGLGLSVVRRIVQKLGGQVHVSSAMGQGSVFGFTLPDCQKPAAISRPDRG